MSLREQIIAEIVRRKNEQCCTWWFKFKVPFSTAEIRRELERMERDKLVTADRSQRNNTKWLLI